MTYILCHAKRWFLFSKFGFCVGTNVFEEALNAIKFLNWLQKFGPAQKCLGIVKGQGNINSKPDFKTILTPLCTRNDFTRKSYCSSRMVDTNGHWKIPVFQSKFCLVMYCFDGLFLFSLWFSSCQKPSKIRLGVVPVNLPIFFQWFNRMRNLNIIRNSNSEFIETLKGFVHDRRIFPLSEIQISMKGRFFFVKFACL